MAEAPLAHRNSLQSTEPGGRPGEHALGAALCPPTLCCRVVGARLQPHRCCHCLSPRAYSFLSKFRIPDWPQLDHQYRLEGGRGGRRTEDLLPLPTGPPLSALRFPNIKSVFPCCANTHWRMSARLRLHFGAIPLKAGCRNKAQIHWDTLALHSVLESTLVLRIYLKLQFQRECW